MQPDNNFEISLDGSSISTGSLLSDVQPPVNPPAEIDDPDDTKPETWDEREKIPDPDAEKPEDWDEDAPATIPDPAAKVKRILLYRNINYVALFLPQLCFS